jgi:Fur family transcriptional regulator, stress-responsive regulator
MASTTTDPAEALRAVGLRVTRPRLAVIDALSRHPHVDADSVHEAVHEAAGTVSRQAVYDVLNALTDAGLVRRLLIDNRSRYELDLRDNHHHLLCRSCGRLHDVPCAVGRAPCLHPSDDLGFEVDLADVLYSGICPDCAARRQAAEEPAGPTAG